MANDASTSLSGVNSSFAEFVGFITGLQDYFRQHSGGEGEGDRRVRAAFDSIVHTAIVNSGDALRAIFDIVHVVQEEPTNPELRTLATRLFHREVNRMSPPDRDVVMSEEPWWGELPNEELRSLLQSLFGLAPPQTKEEIIRYRARVEQEVTTILDVIRETKLLTEGEKEPFLHIDPKTIDSSTLFPLFKTAYNLSLVAPFKKVDAFNVKLNPGPNLSQAKSFDEAAHIVREHLAQHGSSFRNLDCFNCGMLCFPKEFCALSSLSKLDLISWPQLRGANRINSFPPEMVQLTGLKTLYLGANRLTALPLVIEQLTRLETLSLRGNWLSELSPGIGRFTELKTLDLSQNQLTKLPWEIGRLLNLTDLDLAENRLSELPPEIGRLVGLRKLGLRSNRLTAVPSEVGQLMELEELDLKGNPIVALPALPAKTTVYT